MWVGMVACVDRAFLPARLWVESIAFYAQTMRRDAEFLTSYIPPETNG